MDLSEKLELSTVSLFLILLSFLFLSDVFPWLTAVSEDCHLYPLFLPLSLLLFLSHISLFPSICHISHDTPHPFIFFCFRTFLKFVICLSIDLTINIHMIFSKSVWHSRFFRLFQWSFVKSNQTSNCELFQALFVENAFWFLSLNFPLTSSSLPPPPQLVLTVVLHSGSVPLPMSGCDLCMSE